MRHARSCRIRESFVTELTPFTPRRRARATRSLPLTFRSGSCFLKASWVRAGVTAGGLIRLERQL